MLYHILLIFTFGDFHAMAIHKDSYKTQQECLEKIGELYVEFPVHKTSTPIQGEAPSAFCVEVSFDELLK